MRFQAMTIFVLFFGVSLVDALGGGHWLRAAFWLIVGALFFVLERGLGSERHPGH